MISVLIPVYNGAKYLEDALASILQQTYDNYEVLLCDDGSTDNTSLILNKYINYPRFRILSNDKNMGKVYSCNKLYEIAQGDIITIHDCDDLSKKDRFETVIKAFLENSDVHAIGHYIERMNEKGVPSGIFRIKALNYESIKEEMLVGNSSGDASLFIKNESIKELGILYRDYFKNSMDYDFTLRFIEKYKLINIDSTLLYYRSVSNSLSKDVQEPKSLIRPEMARRFALERIHVGSDMLQRDDYDLIEKLEDELLRPYRLDKSLHFYRMAEFTSYCKMRGTALNYSIRAILSNPRKFSNWRLFQHCLRKKLIGF